MDPAALAEDVAARLRRHRVVEIARENLNPLLDGRQASFFDKLLALLQAHVDRHALRSTSGTLAKVDPLLEHLEVLWIKGTATSGLYDAPYMRYATDLDFLVRDFATAWRAIEALSPIFALNRVKLYVYPEERFGGNFDLPPRPGHEDLLTLDMQVGGFHVWGATRYRASLWERATRRDGRLVPSWEDCLLLAAAHVATQWEYRTRDLNDVWSIVQKVGRSLDWDYIERTARAEQLTELMALLVTETERSYGERLPDVPARFRRPGSSTRLFARANFGLCNPRIGALMQASFNWPSYRRHFGWLTGGAYLLRNGANLIRFPNRAYHAGEARYIRRIRPNEMLVLVPLGGELPSRSGAAARRWLEPGALCVVNEGSGDEFFITPQGLFAQASYHGDLPDADRRRILGSSELRSRPGGANR